jgi:hypothetical protein
MVEQAVAVASEAGASGAAASVVAFQRRDLSRKAERAALLDAVGSAGTLDIAPRAFAARDAAAALHLMGFVDLEEVLPCGEARALSPHQARLAAPYLAWRIRRAAGR